jgi:hypothetical protein
MRGLMRALLAIVVIAALFVPCTVPDDDNHHLVVATTLILTANRATAIGGERNLAADAQRGSRVHCQQDGLAVTASADLSPTTVAAAFGLTSPHPLIGQTLPVVQRPPILRA